MSEDLSSLDPAAVLTDVHANGTVHAAPLADREALEAAQQLAAESLGECCRELVEMDATHVLRDGVVRRIESLISQYAVDDARFLAVHLVKDLAVRRVAESSEQQAEEMEWILFYDLAMHWHQQSGSYVASDTAALLQKIQKQVHAMIDRQPRLECFRR